MSRVTHPHMNTLYNGNNHKLKGVDTCLPKTGLGELRAVHACNGHLYHRPSCQLGLLLLAALLGYPIAKRYSAADLDPGLIDYLLSADPRVSLVKQGQTYKLVHGQGLIIQPSPLVHRQVVQLVLASRYTAWHQTEPGLVGGKHPSPQARRD